MIASLFNKIRKSDSKKTIINSGWLIAEKIISMLFGIITSGLVARYFGTILFGKFNYANSLVTLFTVFATAGLETIVVKEIVEGKFKESDIILSSFVLRVSGGILLTILAYISAIITKSNDEIIRKIVIILSIDMIIKASEVLDYWTQAHQMGKQVSIIRFIACIVATALKLFVVFFKFDLFAYSMIYAFQSLVIGLLLFLFYLRKKKAPTSPRINFCFIKKSLKQSFFLILSGLVATLYTKIDQLMLGNMMPSESVLGVYSVAVMIANMWLFVPNSIIVSFKPVIVEGYKTNNDSSKNKTLTMFSGLIVVGVLFGVLISVFGWPFVRIIYGVEYIDAAFYLMILVWGSVFGVIGCGVSLILICESNSRYNFYLVGIGVFLNILLNYSLIPILGGLGAALATLLTQMFSNFFLLVAFKKTRHIFFQICKAFNPSLIYRYFFGAKK